MTIKHASSKLQRSKIGTIIGKSSFPIMHKVGNVGILYYSNLKISFIEKSITPMLSQRNMKKCKFILKHIGLLTVSNVFSLKLRENSNVFCVYPQLGGFTAPQGNSYDVSASAQTIMYVRSACN